MTPQEFFLDLLSQIETRLEGKPREQVSKQISQDRNYLAVKFNRMNKATKIQLKIKIALDILDVLPPPNTLLEIYKDELTQIDSRL